MAQKGFSFFRSVGFRLFLSLSALVAIIAAFIYWYFPDKLQDQTTEAVRSKGATMSEFIAFAVNPVLVFGDKTLADETMEALASNPSILYTVLVDSNKKVFAHLNLKGAQNVNYAAEENADRISWQDSVYMLRTPVTHNDKTIGFLYTGHSLRDVIRITNRTRLVILAISLAVFSISLIVVLYLSQWFSKPLRRMAWSMQRVGEGDLAARVKEDRSDEIGTLAREFNNMVTRLDETTAEIRKREVLYRNLVESMNEGLVELSPDLKITFANQHFCTMFGQNAAEISGKPIWLITGMKEEDRHILRDALSRGQNHAQLEFELFGKNKRKIWALVSIAPELNSDGRGVSAIFTNITSLKATEAQLLYRNRELDTFVYKASHDLKAPLSSIAGLVSIARNATKDPEALQYLDLIDRTVGKMDDVLHGLLEVGWIRQNAFQTTEVDIAQQVDLIYESIQHTAGFSEIEFRKNTPDKLVVESDYKLLYSILQNVIQNAFKYHRETGIGRWVQFALDDKGNSIQINVSDNGPGIPQEAQHRIFDMFYRATNRNKGSGLGLYIVKTAVEKLGGTISLFSREGEGTTFTIDLPKELPGEEENK